MTHGRVPLVLLALALAPALAFAPALALTTTRPAAAHDVNGFHATADRAGLYTVPGLTPATVAQTRPDAGFAATLPGLVNAQPLFFRPPGARHGWVIAASEANQVAAFDAATGHAVWRRTIGPPAPRAGRCGNIDPVGITATPVIAPALGALYLDAVIGTGQVQHHAVFGLALTTGATLPGFPLNIHAALGQRHIGFDDAYQESRSALAWFHGQVTVAFGGYAGDCGPYHGVVVGIAPTHPRLTAAWVTKAAKGGIWNPAGPVSDGNFLYLITGNTEGADSWGGGEALLRFPPSLRQPTYFVPENWPALDATDRDLGGVNPVLLDVPGVHPSRLVLVLGKGRKAYLLDPAHLPGIGHALLSQTVSTTPLRGSTATFRVGGSSYVVMPDPGLGCPKPGGLTALAVSARNGKPVLRQAWCAALEGGGSPIVTEAAPGRAPIVWAVGAEGDERLHAFDGLTGKPLYTSAPLPALVPHFSTPMVAAGRLYIPADGRILAFSLPGPTGDKPQ